MPSIGRVLCLLLFFVSGSLQINFLPKNTTFKAATVNLGQYYLTYADSCYEEHESDNYVTLIESAKKLNVDIVVFPHRGERLQIMSSINVTDASYIPEPEKQISICNSNSGTYSKSLKKISCAAKNAGVYVMLDYKEKEDCPVANCTSLGFLLYHTYIVFDRNGAVVVRYREKGILPNIKENIPSQGSLDFEPDFDFDFGKFQCLTINVTSPERIDVDEAFVMNEWYSELVPVIEWSKKPNYWTAETYHHSLNRFFVNGCIRQFDNSAWSFLPTRSANDSKMLTIKDPLPKNDTGSSRNSMVLLFTQTESLVLPNWQWKRLFPTDFPPYASRIIHQQSGDQHINVCQRNICCELEVSVSFDRELAADPDASYYRYRFGIYNGTRIFDDFQSTYGWTCAILPCLDDTEESCGQVYEDAQSISPVVTLRRIAVSIWTNARIIKSHIAFYNSGNRPLGAGTLNWAL